MKVLIPCNEANHVCDKNQYKEASLLEKIKLTIHLLYCKACRKYSKNNSKLTQILSKEKGNQNLDSSAKISLKSAFEKELQKHQ